MSIEQARVGEKEPRNPFRTSERLEISRSWSCCRTELECPATQNRSSLSPVTMRNDQFKAIALGVLSSLYNAAFRLSRDSHDAEDLLQDTHDMLSLTPKNFTNRSVGSQGNFSPHRCVFRDRRA